MLLSLLFVLTPEWLVTGIVAATALSAALGIAWPAAVPDADPPAGTTPPPRRPMTTIGISLSSEENAPRRLVEIACAAGEAGFDHLAISDHFHPWNDEQGQSPHVWSVIGAIAAARPDAWIGTTVTCPTFRIHPLIIAQAAATAQELTGGRFFLGVGSGENLNEHILGQRWPEAALRLEMLREAVELIRQFWKGGTQSWSGRHFTVENARIYSLPSPPPPIHATTP